jgi:hypothetical protein
MPRGARHDSPGTLHHVIIRGVEKREIVSDDKDRVLAMAQQNADGRQFILRFDIAVPAKFRKR